MPCVDTQFALISMRCGYYGRYLLLRHSPATILLVTANRVKVGHANAPSKLTVYLKHDEWGGGLGEHKNSTLTLQLFFDVQQYMSINTFAVNSDTHSYTHYVLKFVKSAVLNSTSISNQIHSLIYFIAIATSCIIHFSSFLESKTTCCKLHHTLQLLMNTMVMMAGAGRGLMDS